MVETRRPDGENADEKAMFAAWQEAEGHVDLSDIKPDDYLVFILFWALFFVVFLQFFTRYVLNDSYGWTEEVARYLLIALVFIGSIMAMRKGAHLSVELLLDMVPGPVRRILQVFIDFCVFGFGLAMTWTSAQLALNTRQAMSTIDFPKAYIYWIVCLSFLGISYYAGIRAFRRLREELPKDNHPLVD